MLEPSLPPTLKDLITRELERGERIIWSDRPRPRFFNKDSIASFLFAIPWTAFALFWTGFAALATSEMDAPTEFAFFPLFGLPFILIGLWLLSAPLRTYRSLLKTAYVITNQRVIIFRGAGRSTHIQSVQPTQLGQLQRHERADGSGDVIIEPSVRLGKRLTPALGLFGVPDAKQAERHLKNLIQQVQTKADATLEVE